ncbi:MAG TPA: hypothetical protein VHP80_09670, partial [Candidatus Acidoferrum sp.]|nr:hypothetical protein [Candidatus Acidoferrum sp.]
AIAARLAITAAADAVNTSRGVVRQLGALAAVESMRDLTWRAEEFATMLRFLYFRRERHTT